MTVIAMTREMGTLGKDVAAEVAERLGIVVVHHELVERHLAQRLATSESAVHRFLEGEASLWERWRIDSKRLSRFTAEEILEMAIRGNVLIRGWGAAQLLRDVPHVMRVRVCAPMTNRVQEMMRRLGISDEKVVRREIDRNDDAHERAVQRQFQVNWRDATGYDIVINTGHVPVSTAAALLQQLAKSGAYEPTEASRTALVDKLLVAQVRSTLDELAPDSPIGSGLGVSVHGGRVVITGVVSQTQSMQRAVSEIEHMPGVKSVANETVRVSTSYGP